MELIKKTMNGFGYELEKPICVMGAYGANDYIFSLESVDGFIINRKRTRTELNEKNRHITDVYSIFVLKEVDSEPVIFEYELYVDIYNFITDDIAPEGFSLR